MASLKDLRNRIASVKATQKITKAMKMVAAAKLRRATEAAEASRPYAERLEAVVSSIASKVTVGPQSPKLLAGSGHGDEPVDHHIAAVGELEGVVGVLLDEEDGQALGAVELPDRVEDLLDDERGEAQRGLVQQQEPRPLHERADDLEEPPLPEGQRRGRLAGMAARTRLASASPPSPPDFRLPSSLPRPPPPCRWHCPRPPP